MYSLGRESCRDKPVGAVKTAAFGVEGEFVLCGIAVLSTLILYFRAMKWF